MACEDKRDAFQGKLTVVQGELQAELSAIAQDTEAKAKAIADDFEQGNDLAEGVGAAAGTAIGGFVGGPAGAIAGNLVGKTIGSLFVLEIGTQRETVVLDVPQVSMKTQDFSFDLPVVVVHDTDISFDLPTLEMRREYIGDYPETRVVMEQRCVGSEPFRACFDVPVVYTEMKPAYADKPVTVMRTQRIVIGLPSVEMRRQDIKVDLPDITVKPTEFSADVPYVTLRFIKDAGKRTAALAAALAQSAQEAAVQKQAHFKDRLRLEIAPLAKAMFDCHRDQLLATRASIVQNMQPQIDILTTTLANLAAQGVPDTDPNRVETQKLFDAAVARLNESLKSVDDALAQLAQSSSAAMKQFLGDEVGAKAKGGLMQVIESKEPPAKGVVRPHVPGLVYFRKEAVPSLDSYRR